MSNLHHPAVKRVRACLAAAGSNAAVIELSETARSAQDAADSIGTELGSIVKSLVFAIAGKPVMALVAGDRHAEALGHGQRQRQRDRAPQPAPEDRDPVGPLDRGRHP